MTAPRLTAAERRQKDAIAEQRRKTVDEYGSLIVKLAPFKADVARLADLAKSIRDWTKDESPGVNVAFEGDSFIASLGPCGMETVIPDMNVVYQSLGHERFLKSCSMSLKALEAAGADVATLTVKQQTGTRGLTVTPKAKEHKHHQ